MRQVISSQMDEKFRPVHGREWNLAAIGLPRVNPKNQRRPTMTPKGSDYAARQGRGTVFDDLLPQSCNGNADF